MQKQKSKDLVHITGEEGNFQVQVYGFLLSKDYIWDTMIGTAVSSRGYQVERYRGTHTFHMNHSDHLFPSTTNSYN